MLRTLIAAVVMAAGILATAGDPLQAQRVNNDRTESFISATRQAQVEAIARGFMRRLGIKGLSMAVGRNGRLLIATGFGEARPGLPSGKNTIYPIGKISQQFTAAALLWWQDRKYRSAGIVRVNDPVSEYFFGVAHWQGMKLSHLLTHTSGLPPLTESVFFQERLYSDVKAEKILDFVKGRELAFMPGSQFQQSHSNYFLIAQTIEVGLEIFFQDYIKTEVFALNQMTRSGFIGTTSLRRRAQGYVKGRPSKEVNPTMFFGSADATSTAVDLVKFDRQLMRGKLFSAVARAAMFGKHVRVERGLWYGAGWFIRDRGGREEYFNIGDLPGFTSINKIYRNTEDNSDYYVVVLTNADKIRGLEPLADRLLAAMK